MSAADDFRAVAPRQEGEHLHRHQVDQAAERLADVRRAAAPTGRLTATGLQFSRVADLLEGAEEVGPFAVHLVDEGDAGHVVLVGLPPDGLALGLDAFAGAEDHHAAVQHAEAPLDLGGEIDVAGRVDEVDVTSCQGKLTQADWMVMPRSCSSGS